VNQTAVSGSLNSATSNQAENQTQDADTTATRIQNQFGPEFCCDTQVGGGAGNVNSVTQSNVLANNTGGVSQASEQGGHCTESGTPGASCSVDQTFTSNSGTNHFNMSGPFVSNDRFCTNVEGSASCSSGG
jgi:hypothetical protein